MTAGKLASAKPAATTNTFLYRCPIDKAASTVLNVANQGSSASSYRVALRDYDQTLTLDSSAYKFRQGNVISSYIVSVTPGLSKSSLTPGSKITLTNNNGSFKFMDIIKPTTTVTIPVKVETIGSASITAVTGGSFSPGTTLTGANGLTGTIYYYNSTNGTLQLNIAGITNSSTSFRVSGTGTEVSTSDLLNIDTELVTVTGKTGNSLTVTRASSATAAAAHTPGASVHIVRPTATTTTLSAAITDTAATSITVTSAASLNVGDYIRIGNEFLLIGLIVTNTLTVSRGQLGTTAATALNGATVTRHTDQSYVSLQYFANGEAVTSSAVSATISSGVSSSRTFNPATKFIYDIDNSGTFSLPPSLTFNVDRTYRFTQSDSSNTGESLYFSLSAESGTSYTVGVTTSGTAGSSGAYTQISTTSTTAPGLVTRGTTSGIGTSAALNLDPLYSQIYVYDVEGSLAATNAFNTTTGSNDISAVFAGPYGYVQGYTSTALKVTSGLNSSAFSTLTTTVTGTSGQFTFTVGSATGLIQGMAASGTGIGTGARITNISGTTVTVDVANSATVSGTGTFNHTFYDSPRTTGASRSIATVSSLTTATDVNAEDYLFYDKALAGNTTDKNSSILIGPGQSLVVYSAANTISYSLNGFEDSTSDLTIYNYLRV
jgi:hypothetical protein